MKSKFIPAETSFKEWKKDPKYVEEYAALEEEFALASALIEARSKAVMTQPAPGASVLSRSLNRALSELHKGRSKAHREGGGNICDANLKPIGAAFSRPR